MKYAIVFAAALAATSAFADDAPVLTADDIRASLAECNNQFGAATKAYTTRGQDYAANLSHASATVAALQETIKQIDAEQDAEQDDVK